MQQPLLLQSFHNVICSLDMHAVLSYVSLIVNN